MTAREVELSGGAPWGFRMHGGADQNQPLRISRRYSDTLERSLDVNPGRKASLSGIREGDVISSINGRPTKGMTNSDAHAMLRCAGPVLKLGLNEDREMSPRRRSIGKGSELKRPSQLIAEVQKATPQAPVYATIRPSQSSQNRPSSSPMRSSLNSLPSALDSTPLVKSVAPEEPPKIHPTNPFYTTLPSNYSSASKLPVPNGRGSFNVDRNKKETFNDYGTDLKSPSLFVKTSEDTHSFPYNKDKLNGYETETSKCSAKNTSDSFSTDKFNQFDQQGLPNNVNSKNPFKAKRNSDPFDNYIWPEKNLNGKNHDNKNLPESQSESNFHRNEEVIKHSTITEHKISEVEEVRTIKKIILNGSADASEQTNDHPSTFGSPGQNKSKFEFPSPQSQPKDYPLCTKSEYVHTPTNHEEYFSSSFDKKEEARYTPSNTYKSAKHFKTSRAETSVETVASKPPVKPETAHAPLSSPSKRLLPSSHYLWLTQYVALATILEKVSANNLTAGHLQPTCQPLFGNSDTNPPCIKVADLLIGQACGFDCNITL